MALPEGSGKISQYHYLNGAGETNFGFVNGNGHYQRTQRLANGDILGEYGYIDADGKPVHVRYTSGVEGYKVLSSDSSEYNVDSVRSDIPDLTAAADLSEANWETTYDFTHSNDKSYPDSDLYINARVRIDEPENGFDSLHEYSSGPINN